MVQAEASGKTCFDIGEAQPIDAERGAGGGMTNACFLYHIDIKLFLVRHTPLPCGLLH